MTEQTALLLPNEIVEDVLLRLPAKALVRFRVVCKSWKTLITDPYFVKAHLQRWSNQNPAGLFLMHRDRHGSRKVSYRVGGEQDFVKLVPPFNSCLHHRYCASFWRLGGSCNGLVCVTNYCYESYSYMIYVWNPSIRECIQLPNSELQSHPVNIIYSAALDDYKVVKMGYTRTLAGLQLTGQIEVYSLKMNSWTSINVSPPPHHFLFSEDLIESGVIVNGCMHWFASRMNTNQYSTILCFDMIAEDVFYEISLPPISKGMKIHVSSLGECLSVAVYNSINYQLEVWVMNRYGVPQSWTKRHEVALQNSVVDTSNWEIISTLSSKLLLRRKKWGELISYDTETKKVEHLTPKSNLCYDIQATAYFESLVSVASNPA